MTALAFGPNIQILRNADYQIAEIDAQQPDFCALLASIDTAFNPFRWLRAHH